ncbi:heme biosynthesis protein HemY [Colwellia sp. BRX10-3]|uniref:heme biosynthesis HemY N-terminal domain-containing protein n=1 Tax=Colwellia sp. BRX10-3 TaxID=2759844 RepID=UPI0015F3733A|nr:heme biosynthesis HemY N-terminal domain-containing protein [Colwellia sp. BRX10-3]MBA6390044.1 heme biosynthesis protein HemY [Colwellia sp. BRX10-3]
MKRILLLLTLFLVVVVITPMLIGEKGYILVSIGDFAIESTVITAIITLALCFLALALTIKFFRGGISFSFAAWNKIAFASRRRALKDFNKGIAAYVLGDYKQAEHLLAKSADASTFEHIAYLVAADAAQKQALKPNTDHYLGLLEQTTNTFKEAGLEAVLIKIKLLIGQQNYQQARTVIDEYHKHIGHDARLLRLEIELSLVEQRFDYVIKQLNTAQKQKSISTQTITLWQQQAFYGAFNSQIKQQDKNALLEYWQQLPKKIKQSETVVLAYCQVLAENQVNEPLAKLLLPVIKKGNAISLLKAVRTLPITQDDRLMAAAQKHLHSEPHNALWLSLVAHFAMASQQWPLAEKAFNSLVNLEDKSYDKVDLLAFSLVLEQQGHLDRANQVLRKIHA